MRRSAMMEPVVGNTEIVLLIWDCKLFSILITPPKRGKLALIQSRIQIADRHVGESRLQQNLFVKRTSADDQRFRFLIEYILVDQPLHGLLVEFVIAFMLLVLPGSHGG